LPIAIIASYGCGESPGSCTIWLIQLMIALDNSELLGIVTLGGRVGIRWTQKASPKSRPSAKKPQSHKQLALHTRQRSSSGWVGSGGGCATDSRPASALGRAARPLQRPSCDLCAFAGPTESPKIVPKQSSSQPPRFATETRGQPECDRAARRPRIAGAPSRRGRPGARLDKEKIRKTGQTGAPLPSSAVIDHSQGEPPE
jgi:hypothetical protein